VDILVKIGVLRKGEAANGLGFFDGASPSLCLKVILKNVPHAFVENTEGLQNKKLNPSDPRLPCALFLL
jgi:hypothetical protein